MTMQSFTWHVGNEHIGAALLWYQPEKRLSVSFSLRGFWHNVRLYGPRKLSFER
jgi:hypothetical protein